ncbi:MAG: hypothetical protein IKY90_08960 [Oscillospiraceae bacterium]|nr:hypothetical protein [Oscillospiraceae bacterium]
MAYFIGQLIACFMAAIVLAVFVAFAVLAISGVGIMKFWITVAVLTIILILTTN